MIRGCKSIDITQYKKVLGYISECLDKHCDRKDFGELLQTYGKMGDMYYVFRKVRRLEKMVMQKKLSKDEYAKHHFEITQAYTSYKHAKKEIAKEACKRIRNRNLALAPIIYSEKYDYTTGKLRLIGKASAMQQVLDHIAVKSCEELLKRRIVKQQCSSIKGRGQVYGMKLIKRFVEKDNRNIRYSSKHLLKYTSRCNYVVKLDIKKCFPSADMNVFIDMLKHDCANQDIIWLWEALLSTHKINGYTGMMIGAFSSQWAMQYMLSFVYRFAMGLHTERRGNSIKCVSAMFLFMDDMALFGSSRKNLKYAVRKIIEFVKERLHLIIKPNWSIQKFEQCGLDMMGYVIHRSGKVTIRDRNYLKARRLALRCDAHQMLTFKQCKRILSYKGYFKFTNCRKAMHKYGLKYVFRYAAKVVSAHSKITGGNRTNVKSSSIFFRNPKANPVQFAA